MGYPLIEKVEAIKDALKYFEGDICIYVRIVLNFTLKHIGMCGKMKIVVRKDF